MDKSSDADTDEVTHPTPNDFDRFLPWACSQLNVDVDVIVTRKVIVTHSGGAIGKGKGKPKSRAPSYSDTSSICLKTESQLGAGSTTTGIVNVETVYDNNHNLIQIKFTKNKRIPRLILKIINLILPFHTALSAISIDSGLHSDTVYEISKLLSVSRITEVCFDYTYLKEANYYVLFGHNHLQHLSLSKCKITDEIVQTIASHLMFPYPASNSLSVLNLATNRITDLGASYLADALRTNRQLSYLNIADNMITDKGATSIFEVLTTFPLNSLEIINKRDRKMAYLKKKNDLIIKKLKDLQAGDYDKKGKKRPIRPPPSTPIKTKTDTDTDFAGEYSKSVPAMDLIQYERAENIVESLMGPFSDPFSQANTEMRGDAVYCYGNNTLCYLNLAYNDLTYLCLNKLHEVLLSQKFVNRRPKGLLNVIIEGNCLPIACTELQQINDLLESGFENIRRMSTAAKKRSSGSKHSSK